MAGIQHRDARRLLKVIFSAIENGKTLTYLEAARLLRRKPPRGYAQAIAQMCALLDAAACLAGVPLLAHVAVLTESREINPKAWKEYSEPQKDAIIRRSKGHQFLGDDREAISSALEDLRKSKRGNKKAWEHVRHLYGNLLYRRLVGDDADAKSNAIDDLGTDIPEHRKSETWSYARDSGVRAAVLQRAGGKCEFCGKPGFIKADGTRYLESHHVIALADEGADMQTNVIALCPNDHREAHFGGKSAEIEAEMIRRLRPQISGARVGEKVTDNAFRMRH